MSKEMPTTDMLDDFKPKTELGKFLLEMRQKAMEKPNKQIRAVYTATYTYETRLDVEDVTNLDGKIDPEYIEDEIKRQLDSSALRSSSESSSLYWNYVDE